MRSAIIRVLAFVGGTGVLVYAVTQNVAHVGGWGSPRAGLPVVVGVIVWLCNIILAEVLLTGRWRFSALIGCVLLLAEGVNQIATTERLQEARLDAVAPYAAAEQKRLLAGEQLRKAEQALAGAPTTNPRLQAALSEKGRVDRDLTEKSSARTCAENCRLLLIEAVRGAETEVKAARQSLDQDKLRLREEVTAARLALSALPVLREAGPPEQQLWFGLTYGQLVAGLTSLTLNVGVSALLAFAIHPPVRGVAARDNANGVAGLDAPRTGMAAETVTDPVCALADATAHERPTGWLPRPTSRPDSPPATEIDVEAHALQFARDCLRYRSGALASFPQLHMAYRRWCERRGEEPHALAEIVPALQSVLLPLGVRGAMIDDVPCARDVIIVGAMASDAA